MREDKQTSGRYGTPSLLSSLDPTVSIVSSYITRAVLEQLLRAMPGIVNGASLFAQAGILLVLEPLYHLLYVVEGIVPAITLEHACMREENSRAARCDRLRV